MQKISPTDQESIINISHSKLYDLLRVIFRNQPDAYSNISAIQSHQEYITIPESAKGYISEVYENSVPDNFPAKAEYEPYQPQFEQFVKTLIQRSPMIQSLINEADDQSYDPEKARMILDHLLEVSRQCILEEQGFDNINQDNLSEPVLEPDLSSLASGIIPENSPNQMPDMPDMDPMDEQELQPTMELEMLAEANQDAMPDQITEMPDMEQMQVQEQQMSLEMLINLLLGGSG